LEIYYLTTSYNQTIYCDFQYTDLNGKGLARIQLVQNKTDIAIAWSLNSKVVAMWFQENWNTTDNPGQPVIITSFLDKDEFIPYSGGVYIGNTVEEYYFRYLIDVKLKFDISKPLIPSDFSYAAYGYAKVPYLQD